MPEEVINPCEDCGYKECSLIKLQRGVYEVQCDECGVTGSIGDNSDEAIKLWNEDNYA